MTRPPKEAREWLASIGAKGGQKGGLAKGKRKARSPEHYKKMAEARRKKKAATDDTSSEVV